MTPRVRALRLPFLLLVLARLSTSTGSAQVIGFDRDDFAAPVGTRGIVCADLNGDGWADLALANTTPGTMAVLLNRGAGGGFVLAQTVSTGGGPFDITAGDFDRDGRIDLAVANADNNTIDVFLTGATSAASWSAKLFARYSAPGGPRGLTNADVDGNGTLDIVYTAFYQNNLTVLYGNGDGQFSARGLPAIAVGARPQGVAAADLNRDGRTDLVVANTGASLMTALYGNGAGAFTRVDVAGPQQLNVVRASDLNGDGWVDVAAISTGRNTFAVFRGAAAGLHVSSTGGTGASPRGLAAADLDDDGRLDLIVANRADSSASIILQSATGAFNVSEEVPAGSGARAVAVADFNHDGRPDFATGNEFARSVSVFRNSPGLERAAYAFSRAAAAAGPVGDGIVVSDLNHNGKPDVVAGNTVALDGDPATAQTLPILADAAIRDVAVLDWNRDGHPDIAVLFYRIDYAYNSVWDGYYMFYGDGTGRFVYVFGTAGFAYSRQFAVGDLNRDGWDDIVIASRSPANWSQSALYVVLNSRQGASSVVRQTQLTGQVFALALGDVTTDGKLDVVLSLNQPNALTVQVGDGTGGFSTEAETSIETTPFEIALADFTGDGHLDFIAAAGSNILALTGNGKGHYTDVQTYQPTYIQGRYASADKLLAADLTDDGLVDIVTGSGLILPGREDGTFGPSEEFDWYYWYEAQAADWDLDGDLDLVANQGYLGVEVLVNHRTRPNTVPVADAGSDTTFAYHTQFDREEWGLDGWSSSDADLHALAFEWRKDGNVIGYGSFLHPGWLAPGTHTFELTVRDGRGGEARDTVVWTVTNSPEVVIYAHEPNPSQGDWQVIDDDTAAGGFRLWNPNQGAAKVNTPLASPAHYVDLWFSPDPTLEYKLWIRGKAENNYWGNDSAWLQFSDAVDTSGKAAYRIGTTSALPFNLEECSGCGISGWGWEDDGWGTVDKPGVTLRFPKAGWQKIRIQTREDGVSIDQIVFSAEKYRTARPGAARNDTTILQRTQW